LERYHGHFGGERVGKLCIEVRPLFGERIENVASVFSCPNYENSMPDIAGSQLAAVIHNWLDFRGGIVTFEPF